MELKYFIKFNVYILNIRKVDFFSLKIYICYRGIFLFTFFIQMLILEYYVQNWPFSLNNAFYLNPHLALAIAHLDPAILFPLIYKLPGEEHGIDMRTHRLF